MPRACSTFLLALVHLTAGLTVCAAAMLLAGCTPQIGDHCNLNTDCSLQGTRVCDNAQTNGYCTSFNCAPNTCIDNAVCVMLYADVPGCPYNGYQSPSRTQRTLCMKACGQNSDCRTSEGYECLDPTAAPLDGVVLDDVQGRKVCTVTPVALDAGPMPDAGADGVAPVCLPEGPVVPPIVEAGAPDAPSGG
jgi:hypothetical protein